MKLSPITNTAIDENIPNGDFRHKWNSAIVITAINETIERLSDLPKFSPSRTGKRKWVEYGTPVQKEILIVHHSLT